MWTTFLFGATAALFVFWALHALWHLRWMRRLPAMEGARASKIPPAPARCSVVLAARNEQARIEQTVRRLLAQREVEAEFIIVDDRSTDRTGEIVRNLAREDSRLRVIQIAELPEGWLGKCHACHVGARAATGDWILFTDGDCWLRPDVLARSLTVAEREQAGHLTIVSGLAGGSAGLKAAHLLFLLSLSNWISGVNRNRKKSYLGIGAFNLVQASAYRQCGGYEALRLTVVDDVKLGLLLSRAGHRTRAFLGGDDLECDWGTTAWGTVGIMQKNYFAAVDYRTGIVLAATLFVLLVVTTLAWGLVSGTVAGLAAALSPLTLILPSAVLARRLGWTWWSAVYVPFMIPLFLYSVVNSTWVTLREGGIRWRETFYPLEELRAGNVR